MTDYNRSRAPIAGRGAVWLLVFGVIAALLISYLALHTGDRASGTMPTPQTAATNHGDNRSAGAASPLGGANGDNRMDKSISGSPPSGAGTSDTGTPGSTSGAGTSAAPAGGGVPGTNQAGGAPAMSSPPGPSGGSSSNSSSGRTAGTPQATGGPGPGRGGG